jgi:hypothetical protein
MSPRARAAMVMGCLGAWLTLGGCGNSDKVIDFFPGSSAMGGAGGAGGKPPLGGGGQGPFCDTDRQCDSPTPYCDRAVHLCVECTSDADCSNNGQRGVCLTVDAIARLADLAAALDAAPLGNLELGRCVECLTDSDCPQSAWCTSELRCRS